MLVTGANQIVLDAGLHRWRLAWQARNAASDGKRYGTGQSLNEHVPEHWPGQHRLLSVMMAEQIRSQVHAILPFDPSSTRSPQWTQKTKTMKDILSEIIAHGADRDSSEKQAGAPSVNCKKQVAAMMREDVGTGSSAATSHYTRRYCERAPANYFIGVHAKLRNAVAFQRVGSRKAHRPISHSTCL